MGFIIKTVMDIQYFIARRLLTVHQVWVHQALVPELQTSYPATARHFLT